MSEETSTNGRSPIPHSTRLARRLASVGWGLFFVWVGFALLMDLGWGIGLIGVATITLSMQVARRHFGIPVEGFWVICGLVLLVGGLWDMFQVEVSLVPILLIAAGAALLLSLLIGGRRWTCRCWRRTS